MHYNCNKILQQKISLKNYKENRIHKKSTCAVEVGISLSAVAKKRKYQRKEEKEREKKDRDYLISYIFIIL